MEARSFNELKLQVMEVIGDNPGVTSFHVSNALGIEVPNARMCLFRLYRQRLVTRTCDAMGMWRKLLFRYEINGRGLDRIQYLKERQA